MNQKFTFRKSYVYIGLGFIAILCFFVAVVKHINTNKCSNAVQTAITIDGDTITIAELNYYVVSAMSYFTSYEDVYNQQGYNLWSVMYNDELTISDYVISVSVEQCIKDNVLYQEAVSHNIALTEDEILEYQEQAATSFEELAEHTINNYSLSQSLLETIYEKKALADKYYDSILAVANLDYDTICESIKLVDFQQYDYEMLEFPFGDLTDGDLVNHISDEKKSVAYDTMTEVYAMLTVNSDMKAISIEKGLNYTSSTSLIGDGSLDEAFESMLVPLAVNEYSTVFETENGYYIIRKLADKSKMAYADAREAAIKAAKDSVFQNEYSSILESHTVIRNDAMLQSILVGN